MLQLVLQSRQFLNDALAFLCLVIIRNSADCPSQVVNSTSLLLLVLSG